MIPVVTLIKDDSRLTTLSFVKGHRQMCDSGHIQNNEEKVKRNFIVTKELKLSE